MPTPVVDLEKCDYCRRCAEVCAYHAIAVLGQDVLVFPGLCHGCGSCSLNCPRGAIGEELRPTGTIEEGKAGGLLFAQGTLNVGEAMGVPVIRQLKKRLVLRQTGSDRSSQGAWVETTQASNGGNPGVGRLPTWTVGVETTPTPEYQNKIGEALIRAEPDSLIILDAPPGTSCPVVECLHGSDYALMVTEPTPFGLHDLKMAVEVARDKLKLLVGVVINRDGVGDDKVEEYCREEGIPVLMRIPLDRRIAEACSLGLPLPLALPEYREPFIDLHRRIEQEVGR